MPRPLPHPWLFVRDSWREFIATWNDSVKVSIWFLYFGLVQFAYYLLIKYVPAAVSARSAVSFAITVGMYWAGVRMIQTALGFEQGKKADVSRAALADSIRLIPPLLWVGILQFMVLLGASLPLFAWRIIIPVWFQNIDPNVYMIGLVALFLPPVYVSIRLVFTQILAIDKGARGLRALADASELVRNRWWALFGRFLFGVVVFGIGLWIVVSALFWVLGLVVGPEKFLTLVQPTARDPLLIGTVLLLESVIQAAFLPLFIIFGVKLYRAFQKSSK